MSEMPSRNGPDQIPSSASRPADKTGVRPPFVDTLLRVADRSLLGGLTRLRAARVERRREKAWLNSPEFTGENLDSMTESDPFKTADELRRQSDSWRQLVGLGAGSDIYTDPHDLKRNVDATFHGILSDAAREIGGDVYLAPDGTEHLVRYPVPPTTTTYEGGEIRFHPPSPPSHEDFVEDPPALAALRPIAELADEAVTDKTVREPLVALGKKAEEEAQRIEAQLAPYLREEIRHLASLLPQVDYRTHVQKHGSERWGTGIDQLLMSSELTALLQRDPAVLDKWDYWELKQWADGLRNSTEQRIHDRVLKQQPYPVRLVSQEEIGAFLTDFERTYGKDHLQALDRRPVLPQEPYHAVWRYFHNPEPTFTGGTQGDMRQIDRRLLTALREQYIPTQSRK